MNSGIKPAWPDIIKKDISPSKRRSNRLNQIFNERVAKERKGNIAAILAEQKAEIASDRAKRQQAAEIRRVMLDNPGKKVRIKQLKGGRVQLSVGGKFQPAL